MAGFFFEWRRSKSVDAEGQNYTVSKIEGRKMFTGLWTKHARFLFAAVVMIATLHLCGVAKPFALPGEPVQYIVNDDSMITLRVAANIAAHDGPYFNAGERTAANTSLFWPYVLSPIFWTGLDRGRCVLVISMLSSFLCAAAIGLVVFYSSSMIVALLTAATLLTLPFIPEYGASGWEHIPQMLIVTLAFLVFLGRVPWLRPYRQATCVLLLSIAFCARPDTLPLIAALALFAFWQKQEEGSKGALLAFIASAAIICSYFLLHRHLYGQFVPNTYYLKVNPGLQSARLGLQYLLHSTWESGLPLFIAGLLGLLLLHRARFSAAERAVVAALMLQTLYIVSVGGDIFYYGRFFIALAPIAVLLFWEKFLDVRKTANSAAFVLAAACIAGVASANVHAMLHTVRGESLVYLRGTVSQTGDPEANQAVLAPYLRSHLSPSDGEIGLGALGALSYYLPEYRVADLLGKADSFIAHEPVKWGPIGHNKWDIVHSLRDRHVAVVPLGTLLDPHVAQSILANHLGVGLDAALEMEPYTLAHYTYRTEQQLGLPGSSGLLIRNDLLQQFPMIP